MGADAGARADAAKEIRVPITIEKIAMEGTTRACVTLAGANRNEVTGREARDIAVRAATPYLGRCGFSGWDKLRYVLPDGSVRETNEDLARAVPDGTRFHQDLLVQAGI